MAPCDPPSLYHKMSVEKLQMPRARGKQKNLIDAKLSSLLVFGKHYFSGGCDLQRRTVSANSPL